jgi:prolyl-tRNA synthetase
MEFYWQEGHTAHASPAEAEERARQMLDIYADFAENEAAVPVVRGQKSESEKFAGALRSFSIEAMMGDTRALQAGTSHNLGDNFARAFEIRYLDQANQQQYCWTTSWGLSTRFIGAIIMVHGDDQGLILPPRLAPYQAVVVPIYKSDAERVEVLQAVDQLTAELPGLRVHVDRRDGLTPGFKFNDWEMRGVPLRIELGPKDIARQQVMLSRRDLPGREGKRPAPIAGLAALAQQTLDEIHTSLYRRAETFRRDHTHSPADYEEFKQVVQDGWADAWWCEQAACEAQIKEDTRASTRCLPLDQPGGKGTCIRCGDPATRRAIFARSY